ncbi:MAG: DUF72 domain-containing protein [Planctomycetes bacterium]|nr:DUF72 domain-containing protein [Planctomycetota bacterium]
MESIDLEIPAEDAGHLRIGTCSWKYDSWKGLIYRDDVTYKAGDYLGEYAERLGAVEVDQWFWSLFPAGIKLPDPRAVAEYAASVPDGFEFAVKAPNAITLTHFYGRQSKAYAEYAGRPNPEFLRVELLERFLAAIEPLKTKLGPVMFQFEYLNRTKMPSLRAFVDAMAAFLAAAPRGYRYAVETRNPNFLRDDFFDLLRAHGAGYVFIDGYHMPPIGEVASRFDATDLPFAVIRLHGGDRKDIEERTGEVWDAIVDPRPEGLRAAADIVRAGERRGRTTYVFANNHYEGSAPLTLVRFLDVLRADASPF